MKKIAAAAKKITTLLLLMMGVSVTSVSQVIDLAKYQIPFKANGIKLYRLDADSLYAGKQQVVVAELKKGTMPKYTLSIAFSDSVLKRTSQFGKESNAIVALNGGFFNVQKGGSVAYLESEGKVKARNRNPQEKWAKTDSLLNGAIVILNNGNLKIEVAKTEAFYEQSSQEKAVLISGPALLAKGQRLPLIKSDFASKRHPRSCLCETENNTILFIAIDGRSEVASGMNLKELQEFLLRLNCRDAINLDGGGSTTLWVNDGLKNEIINKPSDKEGERPVANIVFVR